ncbi:putative ribonuclease H-like domain-containing protein [Tanacetum coccineum]
MLLGEILHDVVGTSGYHCGVLRSFSVERIEQGNESSKILPYGDGSCWKTFKPVASLITKGKLKQMQARSFLVFTVKVNKGLNGDVPGKKFHSPPMWPADPLFSQDSKSSPDVRFKPSGEEEKKDAKDPGNESGNLTEGKDNDVKDVGTEAEMNNLDTFMPVSPIPTTRIHKDHPIEQIIRDLNSAPQTRRMTKSVWTLMDLPNGKRAIGTKWVYMNKKDERGIVIENKARLVAQGYTQEEGIDYDGNSLPLLPELKQLGYF